MTDHIMHPLRNIIHSPKVSFFLPLIFPAVAAIAAWLTVLNGGYLLHGDSGKVHFDATELVNNCWGYFVRPIPTFMLAALYKVGGVNPNLEIMLLGLLTGGTVFCVYWLAKHLTNNQWVGLLAAASLLCLSGFLYYSRTHFGFPLFWLAIMMLLDTKDRPFWAGIAASLAVHSHAAFALPVGIWMLTAFAFDAARRDWRRVVKYILGFAVIWAFVELVWYLHSGIPLEFTLGVIQEVRYVSGYNPSIPWYDPLSILVNDNGLWQVLIVSICFGYLFIFRPKTASRPIWQLVTLLVAGFVFFLLRSSLFHSITRPRFLLAIYYPAIILFSIVIHRLIIMLPRYRLFAKITTSLVVISMMCATLINAHLFSASGFEAERAIFKQAAQVGQPIRYWGYDYAGLFLAISYGVETAVTDTTATLAVQDTQAILVLDSPYDHLMPDSIRDPLLARQDLYTVTSYPHLVMPGPPFLSSPREISSVEIWVPKVRSGSFQANNDWPNYIYYYNGTGCMVPRPYLYGNGFWYDVILKKISEFWFAIF